MLSNLAALGLDRGRSAEADARQAESAQLIAATIGTDHVYTLVATVQHCLPRCGAGCRATPVPNCGRARPA